MTSVTKKAAVETTTAIWEFDPEASGSLLDGGKADVYAMIRTLSVKVDLHVVRFDQMAHARC